MPILIATTRAQDLQPLAAAGQTGLESWQTIHALLTRELSPAHAALLAEPVANQVRGEVDWYGASDVSAVRLADLPGPERAVAQALLDRLVDDITKLAARLAAGRADADRFLSDMLRLALRLPAPDYVYVQAGQPVLAGWAHVRSGAPGGAIMLSGLTSPVFAETAILPPPPSPYAGAPAPRTWLWGVLAVSLLAPLLTLALVWRDPFGWFAVDAPQCRLEPGQLGLAQGLQDEVAREGVLRAELARLVTDAGQRRLMCPPERPPPTPPVTPPPPAPPPQPPTDADRAQREGAQRGKLQVILAWDDRNDLDLRVVCPNGVDINFQRRRACGGRLDVDANGDVNHLTSSPVENVYFDDPPPGTFRVIVDPYGMRERLATPFRVTIHRDGRPDEVVTGTAQNGRHNQTVATFTVDRP